MQAVNICHEAVSLNRVDRRSTTFPNMTSATGPLLITLTGLFLAADDHQIKTTTMGNINLTTHQESYIVRTVWQLNRVNAAGMSYGYEVCGTERTLQSAYHTRRRQESRAHRQAVFIGQRMVGHTQERCSTSGRTRPLR